MSDAPVRHHGLGLAIGAVLGLILWAALAWILWPKGASAGCVEYLPDPPNEPSGVAGCVHYGEGVASMWGGPGVARNDCVYPWTGCQPIRITSLETGISVDRTPTMYCDCYQRPGPNGETLRLVDLDPSTVAALGLNPDVPTLHRVKVEPIGTPVAGVALPNTAMTP